MKPMTVGQVARQSGVGVETVRFYEKNGLLEEPTRRASGYREYGEETVNRLRFILRAKELGFTLSEIRELLSLRCSERPCNDVRERAEAKVAEIEAKVAMLLRMKEVLGRLASSCCGQSDKSRCPILETLDGHEVVGKRRNGSGNDDSGALSGQRDQRQAGRHDDAARPRPRRVSRTDRSRR
jgi:MerR family mercuric resistance operon transcriptional regulator